MARTIVLRLDDGSIICNGSIVGADASQAVHISAEKAAELGRASEKDVARLESLIDRLKAQYGAFVPEPAPVPVGLNHQLAQPA